eukprot:4864066-Amphidinium_carterae.4
MTDWGSEFENTSLKIALTNMGVSLTHAPPYQTKSNGTSERMVGILKSGIRRLMIGTNKPTPVPKWRNLHTQGQHLEKSGCSAV